MADGGRSQRRAECQFPLPHLRQELLQFAQRRLGDLGQHAPQVRLRVDAVRLGRGDQAPQHRMMLPKGVVALPLTDTTRR